MRGRTVNGRHDRNCVREMEQVRLVVARHLFEW